MNVYNFFVLDMYTLFLLFILLTSMVFKKDIYKYSTRILRVLVVAIITLLIIEMLSWTFDSIDKPYAYFLNYMFNVLFFIMGVGAAGLFATYVDYMNFGSIKRLRQRFYYLHAFVFAIVLVIINFFIPILFTIDSSNVYSREPLIALGFGAVYVLLIFMAVQTFKNRKNLEPKVTYSIYTMLILTSIGGIFQLFIYGLLIMWAFSGLGIIIAYIFTETISSSKDFLTNLYTRGITNNYIEVLIEKDISFGFIIIDLDNFKYFNDSFGHKTGDKILIHFSKLLDTTFNKNAIVSRFGGDEFLIIIKGATKEDLINYRIKIEDNLKQYPDYDLLNNVVFSYGYVIREKKSNYNIDELLDMSDKMMYQEKANHKNLKRRQSDK